MSFQIEADYRAQFERQPSRRLPLARRFPIGSALRRLRLLLLAPVVALLSACDLVVLRPAGDVAAQHIRDKAGGAVFAAHVRIG